MLGETNFEFFWDTVLEVHLELYEDMITYTYPFELKFMVSDYCLGWTMSPANITIEDGSGIIDSNYDEPNIFIKKYVLSPITVFDFSFLNYT